MTKSNLFGIAAGVLLASNVGAAPLTNYLGNGQINTFEDNSREVAIDIDGDGFLSQGDVFIGLLALDFRSAPSFLPLDTFGLGDNIYVPFSTQVISAAAGSNGLVFGPTTVPGLDIGSLVGGLPAQTVAGGAVAAVYTDSAVNAVAPNLANANIIDTIGAIAATGDYQLTAGIAAGANQHGSNDFFLGTLDPLVGGSYALLDAADSDSIFSFAAGFSVLENQSGVVTFNGTPGPVAQGGGLFDITVIQGDGSAVPNNDPLQAWLNQSLTAGGVDYNSNHGIFNNADIQLNPVFIPEPATVALIGAGLVGIGATRRNKKAA